MFQSNPAAAETEQRGKTEGVPGSVVDADQACKIFHSDLSISCDNGSNFFIVSQFYF